MSRKIYNRRLNKSPWLLLKNANTRKQQEIKEQVDAMTEPVKQTVEFDPNLPIVTCITPTYGRFPLLCEMVWCWQQQTYLNKELIIVNDQQNLIMTTDIPNVKIFNFNERFVGLGAKRNFAIEQSHSDSEFICPFDDDDLFYPEHISFLVDAFGDNKELERTKNMKHFVSIDNSFFNLSHDTNQTYFGASLFRKRVFTEYRLKDYLIMGEDADLFDNKRLNMYIKQNPLVSSFVHRRGMGIPHASSVRQFSYDANSQREIGNEFYAKTLQFTQPTEMKIKPALTSGLSLYEKIETYRNDHQGQFN